MNRYQQWLINPVAPSFYDRVRPIGKPYRKSEAERLARRHNERHRHADQARRIVLPEGETPAEYVERVPFELDAETAALLRDYKVGMS